MEFCEEYMSNSVENSVFFCYNALKAFTLILELILMIITNVKGGIKGFFVFVMASV